MGMFVCEAMQLLPGEPCEDYAYRFKQLGCACASVADKDAAMLSMRRAVQAHACAMHPSVAAWFTSTDAAGLCPVQRLFLSGWSGWEPATGLGFRLSQDGEPGAVPRFPWDWDTDALVARRDAYLCPDACGA